MEKTELKLIQGGKVTTKDGREFTRLMGGFGDDKPIITVKQISELIGYDIKVINQTINRNITNFKENDNYIKDLKEVTESDHNLEMLKSLGYTNMAISKAKNIYILSEAGFLLYLKFAEGDKAVELYKDFIEDYFKLQAENETMKSTLQEELDYLTEQRERMLGKMFMEKDDTKRIEFFTENEKLNNRIKEIEQTISNQKLIEKVKGKIALGERITEAEDKGFDIGTFSKILKIKDMGRNNLFAWLRYKDILMKNNQPYQKYINYFEVLPVENKFLHRTDYKTMIRPNGIKYIVNKLIEDGKIITKSVDEILQELDGQKKAS